MKHFASVVVALAVLAPVPEAAAQVVSPLPSPVLRGDWPDPDVTEIDGTFYATATSGGWAPTFRILSSTDLRNWSFAGSVFRRPPRWAKDSFWAPELTALPSGGYAVVYSAYPRKRPRRTWYCLGVATAPSPTGPWRDLGRPLRCTPRGTIDATPVLDGDRFYLVYKEDGNAFGRSTPILIQRFAGDGRGLIGKPRRLIANRPSTWERKVVEAPALVQRDGWWHLLYSGNLCCSPRCAYAVGSARSRTLAGPWERNPANPILRSGNGWRCPGHVSIVGDRLAFHAYRAGAFLAGRQLHIADMTFGADGWPSVGDGHPLPASDGAVPTAFDDPFAGASLDPEWEWPVTRTPSAVVAHGLTIAAPRKAGKRIDAAVLARRIGSHRFVASAIVDAYSLSGAETAGLAVVRGGPFAVGAQAIGLAVDGRRTLHLWQRAGGRLDSALRRAGAPSGPYVHLRVTVDGRRARFDFSSDGERWTVGRWRRSPVEETARIVLTVGSQRGATASFSRATSTER
jgi:xylan 1,4-beta-xylosidase